MFSPVLSHRRRVGPFHRSVFDSLGLSVVLSVVLGVGCGGSSTSPPRDAGADRGVGGTPGAVGGTGGAGGSIGVPATGGASGSGTAGVGGTAAGTGGTAAGTGGTAAGTGGAGAGTDAGGDAPADMGTQSDATFPFDLPIPTDLTLPDGAPAIVPCPADVTTAACTNNMVCLRPGPGGMPEGCGCAQNRWFCPGALTDAGIPQDAGLPDVPGVAACAAGVATGVSCAAENEICAGGTGLGCACVQLLGGLRWFCL